MKSCRTCRHLVVPLNRAGKRVPRRNDAYKCQAPIADLPPLPDSVTLRVTWPPRNRMWMVPEDGENCPTYQEIER